MEKKYLSVHYGYFKLIYLFEGEIANAVKAYSKVPDLLFVDKVYSHILSVLLGGGGKLSHATQI